MKKHLILALVLIITLSIVNGVEADDAPIPIYESWIKTKKITCLSVVNPEAVGKDYFLLFDYPPKIGEKLGRPWSIVTKGKCYELEENEAAEGGFLGALYAVKIVTGKERQELSDYSKFKPTDDISPFEDRYDISYKLWPTGIFYIDYAGMLTGGGLEVQSSQLFPTKYEFGLGLADDYPEFLPEDDVIRAADQVFNDEAFLKIRRLHHALNEALQDTIKSCDNRVRVELQLGIKEGVYSPINCEINHIIWRLPDGRDIVVDRWMLENNADAVDIIKLIGCQDAVAEFIRSHLSDFNTIDSLAETLLAKYPDAINRHLKGYGIFTNRDEVYRRKILELARVVEPETVPEIKPSSLEEPTPQKKTELLLQSSNPLMRLYIILPLIALIGIVTFLILKKKSRR